MKRLILAAVLVCLLAGCGKPQVTLPEGYYSGPASEAPAESLGDNEDCYFTAEKTSGGLTRYAICYRYADGDVAEVADLGTEESPFLVYGGRIYYTQGETLCSVDKTGADLQTLYDDSQEQFSFERVFRAEEGWIYCRGGKWADITDDPAALPGPHWAEAVTRVKADLSGFEEVSQPQ